MRPSSPDDTIAAVATGSAPAGLAVVRISGKDALAIARKLAPSLQEQDPEPRRATLVQVVHPVGRQRIDSALLLYFQGPASFTGEDVVELQGHGGARQIAALLDAVTAAGGRLAEPGEFSRRAFLNGRLTLEQAEAIADLVTAESDAALKAARAQLAGALGQRIEALTAALRGLQAEVEGTLDFPDDAGEPPPGLTGRIAEQLVAVEALLRSHAEGRLLREGARVVLAGPANAGKSSLFNALLGEPRALVDEEPGTTRDVLEARLELGGIPCTLVDTAGLRDEPGRVERLGIARTEQELARAELVLWVWDGTHTLGRRCGVLLRSKCELPGENDPSARRVSARTGEGLEELKEWVAQTLRGGAHGEEILVTNRRHAELLGRAVAALQRATGNLELELVGYDLGEAVAALDAIRGRGVEPALLDAIFSRFCIGK